MHAFEKIVLAKVEDSIGSFENSIQDGWIDEICYHAVDSFEFRTW